MPLDTTALPFLTHSAFENVAIPPVSEGIQASSTPNVQWNQRELARQNFLHLNQHCEVFTGDIRCRRMLEENTGLNSQGKGLKDPANINSFAPTNAKYFLGPSQVSEPAPALEKHTEHDSKKAVIRFLTVIGAFAGGFFFLQICHKTCCQGNQELHKEWNRIVFGENIKIDSQNHNFPNQILCPLK